MIAPLIATLPTTVAALTAAPAELAFGRATATKPPR
jgi:hypothetical protein